METKKQILGFYWIAEFDDKSTITQFDSKDKEIMFSEVEAKKDNLVKFIISSADDKESYTVDLKGKNIISPNVIYTLTGKNPELIYKRRNSVRLSVGSSEGLAPSVVHILGIKTDKEEKQIEVFAGQGMKPKKVDFTNLKTSDKLDITKDVKDALVAKEIEDAKIITE